MIVRRDAALVIPLLAIAGFGCDDPVVAGPGISGAPVAPTSSSAEPPPIEVPAVQEPEMPNLSDEAFVERDVHNRDPFRSYASAFVVRASGQEVQRRVLLGNVAVDQLRLIAIVTGMSQPRAMVLAPDDVGWVIKRGDFVGRAEVVQAGGDEGMPVTLNWRVDRIRDNEVVLTREDPSSPNQPPLTRVLPLRQDDLPNPLIEQLEGRR